MWERLDMRRQLRQLAVLTVMGAAAVGCGNSGPREFGKEDVTALRTMTQQFQDAYNAKDSAKVADFFAGAGALMPPNSSAVRGSDSIKGYYDIRFGEGATDLKLDPTTVNGAGSLAYLSGTYSFRNTPDGGPETRDRWQVPVDRAVVPRQHVEVRAADVEQRPASAGAAGARDQEGREEVGGATAGGAGLPPSSLSRPSRPRPDRSLRFLPGRNSRRVLRQVLLVVVLGEVEGPCPGDLGGDAAVARLGQPRLEARAALLGGALLSGVVQ